MMVNEYISFTDYYNSSSSAATKRTDTNWHLIPLTKLTVVPPPFKSIYVNNEGMTGSTDLSDVNGLNYGNRIGKWAFKLMPGYDFDTVRFDMADTLHGGYFRIALSGESDSLYYFGRVTIDEWRHTEKGDYVTIGYNLEPFRYDQTTAAHSDFTISTLNGTNTITVTRTRMPATPSIQLYRLNGTVTISYPQGNKGSSGTTTKIYTYTGSSSSSVYGTVGQDMVITKGVSGEGTKNSDCTITFKLTSGSTVRVIFDYIGGWI